MKITILQDGKAHECDVSEGESIASAAKTIGMDMFGSCKGRGLCCQCSREVVEGVANVLNIKTGKPAISDPEECAPYARTCSSTPTEEGVVINADRKARLW